MLLAVVLCGCGASGMPPSAKSAVLDKPLPSIKRRSIDGASVTTPAGRIVVVKFFAKYCEPCKKTLPTAERLHRENRDIVFIGIAEDEYQAEVEEMIQTFDLTFPVIHDRGNVLAGRFRVNALPATFVADAAGTVRWVGGEEQTEADLEAAIESLQAGR
jgi:thiol-disulfide isomerase/thioredoxin